jgi:hypothetical protein
MIGLPCVTVSPDEMRTLMERVEARPGSAMRIDLPAGTCEIEGFGCLMYHYGTHNSLWHYQTSW